MKKILILGASGMAGHMIYYYLSSLNKYRIYTVCHTEKMEKESIILDIYNTGRVTQTLKEIEPHIVINCIGILINASNETLEAIIYINACFPHLLARILSDTVPDARLIHISTNGVFSRNGKEYKDTDMKDALDIYGMTKNLGEIIDDKNLTIRTAIIGPELKIGKSLFAWIMNQQKTGYIDGYEKVLWNGVTTLELGKAIDKFIEYNITGLYHLSNEKPISKYDLIKLIVAQFNLDIQINKADYQSPDNTILPSRKVNFTYSVPEYSRMIEELYHFMYRSKSYRPLITYSSNIAYNQGGLV